MPRSVAEIFHELQQAQLGTSSARLEDSSLVERPGTLARIGTQLNRGLGEIADLPQRLFLGEDFQEIRAKNPGTVQLELPRAETTGEKVADFARFAPEIGLEAAAIAGTGGVAAPAILARRAAASGVAGGLGGFASAVSDPTKTVGEIATDTAIATGIAAVAPVAFRGAGKALGLGFGAADTGLGSLLGAGFRKEGKKLGAELLEGAADTTQLLVKEGTQSPLPNVRHTSAELMQNLHDNLTKGTRLFAADDLSPEELLRQEGSAAFKSQLKDSVRRELGEEALETVTKAYKGLDTLPSSARQVVEEGMDGMNPQQAVKYLDDIGDVDLGGLPGKVDFKKIADMAFEFRSAAMLSSPLTLMRNFTSTISNQLLRRASDFTAGGASLVKSKLTGQEQEVFVREALAGAKGFVPNRVAKLLGINNTLPQELAEFAKSTKITREVLDKVGGKHQSNFGDNFVAKYIIGAPFKLLSGSDSILYNREFTAEAYRQATNRALRANPKLRGEALQKAVQRFMSDQGAVGADIRKFAQEAAQKKLGDEATEEAVTDLAKTMARDISSSKGLDIGLGTAANPKNLKLGENLNELRTLAERAIFIARENKFLDKRLHDLKVFDPLLKIYMPFRQTPANVARETLRATPLGFFKRWQGIVDEGMDPATARNLVFREQSRAATGTGLALGIMQMIKTGYVRANPFDRSESKAQRDTENASGELQDQIQVGDWTFNARNIGDLGKVILAMQEGMSRVDAGEQSEGMAFLQAITVDLVQRVGDDTFTADIKKGIDLFQNLGDAKAHNKFASEFGASFTPALVRDWNKLQGNPIQSPVLDEESTAPFDSFVAGARSRLPETFASGTDKLGLFGETLIAGEERNSPLAQKMLEVGAFHQEPANLTDIELSASDSLEFRRAKGQLQREQMERVASNPNFNKLPKDVQKKRLDAAFSRGSNIANRRGKALVSRGLPMTSRAILTGKLR